MHDNNIKIEHKIKFSRKTVQNISLKFLYVNLDYNFKNTHHIIIIIPNSY